MPSFRFHENDCASPPRAYQWADGGACVNHVELVRKARGPDAGFVLDRSPDVPGRVRFLPCAAIGSRSPTSPMGSIRGGIAVITGDVAMACSREEAAAIRLVVLVNDVSLRNLIPAELAKGFGFFQSKPSSALSPAAVTPDELGEAWDEASSTCRFSRLSTASPSASPMPEST